MNSLSFYASVVLLFAVSAFAQKPVLEEYARVAVSEGAEIVAYMPSSQMLFVTTGASALQVIHFGDPKIPKYSTTLRFAGEVPSVSAYADLLAVIEMGEPSTQPGFVHLFRMKDSLSLLKTYPTCAHPDMVQFSPDGKVILVVCEGEPNADYSVDPDGGIGWIDLSKGPGNGVASVLDFESLDSAALVQKGVLARFPHRFTQNLEPEYITFDPSGKVAWVSLQENNALARIDIAAKKITDVFPLGSVNHALAGNALDYRQNKKIELQNVPLRGLRQPDGIGSLIQNGRHYVLTANEGASREYTQYTDVITVEELARQKKLSPAVFTPEIIRSLANFPVSSAEPCVAPCTSLYSFGSRSMSVFDGTTGALIWDSGSQIEAMLAKKVPLHFNQNGKKAKFKMDARSDSKGSEPETVTLGEVKGRPLAFLGLERMGGIVVWDMTRAENPTLIDYFLDNRDRGPEGILFIAPKDSPVAGTALLIVGYEYSKTLVVYQVQ